MTIIFIVLFVLEVIVAYMTAILLGKHNVELTPFNAIYVTLSLWIVMFLTALVWLK